MGQKIKFFLAFAVFVTAGAMVMPTTTQAYVEVEGHWRDGNYIEPHIRSEPNGIRHDNYDYDGGSLHNDSYHDPSYDSDWRTPSWSTDPDYYEGRSLHESNLGGSSWGVY